MHIYNGNFCILFYPKVKNNLIHKRERERERENKGGKKKKINNSNYFDSLKCF